MTPIPQHKATTLADYSLPKERFEIVSPALAGFALIDLPGTLVAVPSNVNRASEAFDQKVAAILASLGKHGAHRFSNAVSIVAKLTDIVFPKETTALSTVMSASAVRVKFQAAVKLWDGAALREALARRRSDWDKQVPAVASQRELRRLRELREQDGMWIAAIFDQGQLRRSKVWARSDSLL